MGLPKPPYIANRNLEWLQAGHRFLHISGLFVSLTTSQTTLTSYRFTGYRSSSRISALLQRRRSSLCPSAGLTDLSPGMAPEGDQIEQTPGEIHNHGPELDLKSKKAPTGARARSIKTPLQREALEAAFLSETHAFSSRSSLGCHAPYYMSSSGPPAYRRSVFFSLPAVNQFPAEEVRRALGDRIQLTENQVQVSAVSQLLLSASCNKGLL